MRNWLASFDPRTLVVLGVLVLLAVSGCGAALGSLIGVAAEAKAREAPLPLTFPDLPMQVDTPDVHPGDYIVHHSLRCATDDANSGLGLLPYWYTRRFVDADDPSRRSDLDGGFLAAEVGCHPYSATIHRVPVTFVNGLPTPPGRYYFEGTAIAIGALRTGTVYWRTEVFRVIPWSGVPHAVGPGAV